MATPPECYMFTHIKPSIDSATLCVTCLHTSKLLHLWLNHLNVSCLHISNLHTTYSATLSLTRLHKKQSIYILLCYQNVTCLHIYILKPLCIFQHYKSVYLFTYLLKPVYIFLHYQSVTCLHAEGCMFTHIKGDFCVCSM